MEFSSGCFDYRAYDRAAIKFRGVEADINFNISDYDEDMKQVRLSLYADCLYWVIFKFEGV